MSTNDSTTPNLPVKDDPKKPWKAITAFAISFLGLLWAALEGKADSWSNMSGQEWISIIVPAILTLAGTYAIPNPKTYKHRASGRPGVGGI